MAIPLNALPMITLPAVDLQSAASAVHGMGGSDGEMIAHLARKVSEAEGTQTHLIQKMVREGDSPAKLVETRQEINQWEIAMGLMSALTRKAVNGVETLLKS